MASRAVASLAWFNAKKTGSSSQGMTVRTRGIFRISTTVGLRGFFSPGLYQTGTEIWWAIKEHFRDGVCPKSFVIRLAANHRIDLLSKAKSIIFRGWIRFGSVAIDWHRQDSTDSSGAPRWDS